MARLDRLGPAREVAQLGAVIGREFSYELLHAIHPAPEDQLQTALKAVTDAELLYVRGIPPEALYWFKRALIQDAAYERSPLPRAVQNRPPRRLFRSSLAELQTEKDSLAERGGFEPPVPRGLLWAEFGPSLARYSTRIKASVLERICSLGVRL
jgi:hypothetical protein